VVRTSAFFGYWDMHNFVTLVLKALLENRCSLSRGHYGYRTYMIPDLVNANSDPLIDQKPGLASDNAEPITWRAWL
jgi:dTDP-4-dehydrorhamnose reductase